MNTNFLHCLSSLGPNPQKHVFEVQKCCSVKPFSVTVRSALKTAAKNGKQKRKKFKSVIKNFLCTKNEKSRRTSF